MMTFNCKQNEQVSEQDIQDLNSSYLSNQEDSFPQESYINENNKEKIQQQQFQSKHSSFNMKENQMASSNISKMENSIMIPENTVRNLLPQNSSLGKNSYKINLNDTGGNLKQPSAMSNLMQSKYMGKQTQQSKNQGSYMAKSSMPQLYHVFSNFTKKYFLKDVAKNIKSKIPSIRFKSLEQEHFNILNDKASFLRKDSMNKQKDKKEAIKYGITLKLNQKCEHLRQRFVKFKLKTNHFIDKIQVFEPMHPISLSSDYLQILITSYWIFIYCLHIVYNFQLENSTWNRIARIFTIAYQFLDLMLKQNIGYYKIGRVIINRAEIMENYKKNSLVFDIIGLIPLAYNVYDCERSLITILLESLYLFKIFVLNQAYQRLMHINQLYGQQSYLLQLFLMLVVMIIMCHWIAVFWQLIQLIQTELNIQNTWTQQINIEDANWFTLYNNSFFWALSTVLLIGTGGITDVEVLYSTMVLFLTVGVFAYILGNISQIIAEIKTKTQEYRKDMELINQYMRRNNIERLTQSKIRSYLEYVYIDREKMKRNSQVHDVLDKLPLQLNREITTEINAHLISQLSLFKLNFCSSTIQKLAKIAKIYNYVTNDIIISPELQGQFGDSSIYIINHGQVEICFKNSNSDKLFPIKQLNSGQIFGDISFIEGKQYKLTARSRSFATLLRIRREDFMKILKKKKDEQEKFLYMQDILTYSGITKLYHNRTCLICKQKYHNEQNCSLLAYKPKKEQILLKIQYDQWMDQERQRYFRGRYKTSQAKSQIEELYCINYILLNKQDNQIIEFLENYDEYLYARGIDININPFKNNKFANQEQQNSFSSSSNFTQDDNLQFIQEQFSDSSKFQCNSENNINSKYIEYGDVNTLSNIQNNINKAVDFQNKQKELRISIRQSEYDNAKFLKHSRTLGEQSLKTSNFKNMSPQIIRPSISHPQQNIEIRTPSKTSYQKNDVQKHFSFQVPTQKHQPSTFKISLPTQANQIIENENEQNFDSRESQTSYKQHQNVQQSSTIQSDQKHLHNPQVNIAKLKRSSNFSIQSLQNLAKHTKIEQNGQSQHQHDLNENRDFRKKQQSYYQGAQSSMLLQNLMYNNNNNLQAYQQNNTHTQIYNSQTPIQKMEEFMLPLDLYHNFLIYFPKFNQKQVIDSLYITPPIIGQKRRFIQSSKVNSPVNKLQMQQKSSPYRKLKSQSSFRKSQTKIK